MPGGGGGRSFHFSTNGGASGFNFSSPDDIFNNFFRGGGAGMGDDDDVFSSFGGGGGGAGMPGGFPNGGGPARGTRRPRRPRTPETTVVEKPLPVALEDLFAGATKKLKIGRKTYDERTGRASTSDKILEVPIKKGLRAGSKIKFPNVGDQIEGGTQDIHFVVSEKPHSSFKRDGDDLRIEVEIELKEALCGWQKTIKTIDGQNVSVGRSGVTSPSWTERFPDRGMPRSKKPSERGDFVVGVRIKFPATITPEQKRQLKEIL